jgi:hypothetical protein
MSDWKRKPRNEPQFKNHSIEDIFLCNTCKKYMPWYCFTIGKKILFYDDIDAYYYMNNAYDRGSHQWSCNNCINDLLRKDKHIYISK